MKKNYLLTAFILATNLVLGQDIKLMDHMLYPRLDSAYWNIDHQALNANYSKTANRCQTCVFQQTDTTRGRFCFNTSLGHIQLDTTLHHFSPEKLVGKWDIINFGEFEVTDSILPNSKTYYRYSKILNEKKDNNGSVSFSEKRFKISLINNKEFPNRNKRYKILDGKYLTLRSLSGFCGATILGLTHDGFLILDDHTFRTLAKREKYLIVKTSVRRMIMKKNTGIQSSSSLVAP